MISQEILLAMTQDAYARKERSILTEAEASTALRRDENMLASQILEIKNRDEYKELSNEDKRKTYIAQNNQATAALIDGAKELLFSSQTESNLARNQLDYLQSLLRLHLDWPEYSPESIAEALVKKFAADQAVIGQAMEGPQQ